MADIFFNHSRAFYLVTSHWSPCGGVRGHRHILFRQKTSQLVTVTLARKRPAQLNTGSLCSGAWFQHLNQNWSTGKHSCQGRQNWIKQTIFLFQISTFESHCAVGWCSDDFDPRPQMTRASELLCQPSSVAGLGLEQIGGGALWTVDTQAADWSCFYLPLKHRCLLQYSALLL